MTEKDIKSCFSIKKLIFPRKWHAEHPLAGQNTQHTHKHTSTIIHFLYTQGGLVKKLTQGGERKEDKK